MPLPSGRIPNGGLGYATAEGVHRESYTQTARRQACDDRGRVSRRLADEVVPIRRTGKEIIAVLGGGDREKCSVRQCAIPVFSAANRRSSGFLGFGLQLTSLILGSRLNLRSQFKEGSNGAEISRVSGAVHGIEKEYLWERGALPGGPDAERPTFLSGFFTPPS